MKSLMYLLITFSFVGYVFPQGSSFNVVATDGPFDALLADSTYIEYQRAMVVGSDLDQDGMKEIILTDFRTVSDSQHGRIIVYEVTGDNTLRQAWVYNMPSNGYYSNLRSVATGDLDGNGKGEILVAVTGGSGDTLSSHVGLWVFEWDGISGSDNYQLVAQITDFATYTDAYGQVIYPDRYRCEDLAVGDFDNDGKDEVLWVNNGGTAFDNAYIFSIDGEFSTGFYSTVVETVFKRTDWGYGGSTVSGFGPVDLDGDGNPEGVFTIWNHIGVQIFESDAPNHYILKYHSEGLDPEDRYPFAKAISAYDLNGDGKKELIIGSLLRGRIHILSPVNGDVDSMEHFMPEWTVVDTDSLGNIDTTSMFRIYGLDAGNLPNNQVVLSDLNRHIYGINFKGGALGNPLSYTVNKLYDVTESDTFVTIDSTGAPDTTVCSFYPGHALAFGPDLDNDGQNEVYFTTYVVHHPPDTFKIRTGFLNMLERSPGNFRNILEVQNVSGLPGQEITVPVVLTSQDPISGVQTTVHFDTRKLAFVSTVLDSNLSGFSLNSNQLGDSVKVVIVSLSGDSISPGTDTLFYLNFTIDSNAVIGDSTYIDLSNTVVSDPSAHSLSSTGIGNWIFFRGTKGDLNLDGEVNVTDVVREINIILNIPPAPTNVELWAADVNNDGEVDVTDVVGTINIILGRNKGASKNAGFARIGGGNGEIDLENDIAVSGFQMDLIGNVRDIHLTGRASQMRLFTSRIPEGVRILAVSFNNKANIIPGNGKIIEFVGKARVTNIILSDPHGNKISLSNIKDLNIRYLGPNPVSGEYLKLRFLLPTHSRVLLKIVDVTGRVVRLQEIEGFAGLNQVSIKVRSLKSGVYFLTLTSGEHRVIRKFVKE